MWYHTRVKARKIWTFCMATGKYNYKQVVSEPAQPAELLSLAPKVPEIREKRSSTAEKLQNSKV